MTNHEAEMVVREIGRLRFKNKIKLYNFDAWFLFNITNQIYQSRTLTKNQSKYLLLILYRIKEFKYHVRNQQEAQEVFRIHDVE